jgi:hypothetical protein
MPSGHRSLGFGRHFHEPFQQAAMRFLQGAEVRAETGDFVAERGEFVGHQNPSMSADAGRQG